MEERPGKVYRIMVPDSRMTVVVRQKTPQKVTRQQIMAMMYEVAARMREREEDPLASALQSELLQGAEGRMSAPWGEEEMSEAAYLGDLLDGLRFHPDVEYAVNQTRDVIPGEREELSEDELESLTLGSLLDNLVSE